MDQKSLLKLYNILQGNSWTEFNDEELEFLRAYVAKKYAEYKTNVNSLG